MKKKLLFSIAFALVSCCLTSCNNSSVNYGYGKEESRFTENINSEWEKRHVDEALEAIGCGEEDLKETTELMTSLYGENKEITSSYDEELAASTPYGTYVGKRNENNIIAWKGIPYAKAPIKDLRWKAPHQLDKSNKVYEAYYYGHSAIQIRCFDEFASLYPQGEDCLNICIWNNHTDTNKNKPIMVWIHGGAYITGGSSEPIYDGTYLVKNNPEVIFVSIDYRTSFLGFINFTDIEGGNKYKESANLGLLDQIAALKWLKENASAFGGDPERITIFGESAGGGSVSALTITPKAKGLFKRAIIQSGSVSSFLRTEERSKALTKDILSICGAKSMNDLLELTESDLQKVATIIASGGTYNYTYPQLDGITLPLDINAELLNQTRNGIDILSGTTKDEYEYWSYIMTPQENVIEVAQSVSLFVNKMNEEEKSRFDQFRNNLSGSSYKKDVDTITYLSFHAPCRYEAKTHAANGQKVYQYYFTEEINDGYIDPITGAYQGYGSMHGHELTFLFGYLVGEDLLMSSLDESIRLSYIIQKMWVNFALSGNPSIGENQVSGVDPISWDPYTLENPNVMILNAKECAQKTDPLKENIDIMGDLYWAKLRP